MNTENDRPQWHLDVIAERTAIYDRSVTLGMYIESEEFDLLSKDDQSAKHVEFNRLINYHQYLSRQIMKFDPQHKWSAETFDTAVGVLEGALVQMKQTINPAAATNISERGIASVERALRVLKGLI